jgi:flagellar biosynthetic protein FlhB
MADKDDDTEKSHDPTQHKIDEARKKGDVARSADLDTAATYGGILLVTLAVGAWSTDLAGSVLRHLIEHATELSRVLFDGSASSALKGLLLSLLTAFAAWFLVPALMALLSTIAQRSFVMAPDKIRPRISRINPVQNAKNKFGANGLFEFAKSFVKLVLFSSVLGFYLSVRLSDMAGAIRADARMVGALMAQMMVEFLAVVLAIAVLIGAVDFLWHRFDHRRKLRMSYREIKEEHRQHEGDPHMKQERRQRGNKLAMDQMMSAIPTADVVIVNPTHFAVALKWSRLPGSAPECVAKGKDHIALVMRDRAYEVGVPVRQDPPTARALFGTTEVGQEISPDHYRAVAAAIRFADTMRRRAKTLH